MGKISGISSAQHGFGRLFLFIIAISVFSTAQNFAPATDYPTQTDPLGIASADFNRDGNPDVVVANSGSQTLSLFLGQGDGTFAPPSIINLSPVSPGVIAEQPQPVNVATGDFNGDGNPDIAVAFSGTSITVQILFGNGDGTFLPGVNQPKVSSLFTNFQLTAADFNEDGVLDLAAATDTGFLILLNDGRGAFTPVHDQPFAGNFITHFAVGDINADGHLDLVGILGSGSIQEALGNGDGTFQAPITLPFPVTSTIAANGSIALGDFNRDGRLDIAYTEFGNLSSGAPPAIHINLQRIDGTFNGAQLTLTPTFHPIGLLVGDFNGDGSLDFATLSGTVPGEPNAVVVYLGQGILQFAPPSSFNVSALPSEFLAAHLTHTQAIDLVATDFNANAISVLSNHGANTLTLASSLNPSGLSQPVTFTATVHPTFSGSGSLSGSLMFTDGNSILGTTSVNSSGTGAVTTSFFNAGRHPILAMFSGNSSFVGGSSASLTQVVNRAPTSITLSASTNPSVFAQPVTFSIVISALPGAPAPTGTVNLLDGNSIILSGALDSGGKASLNTSFLAVGTHSLTAQYPGDGNYASATSPALAETVNRNSSTTTLAAAPNPSAFGQPVTFSASVSAAGGASGVATGTVSFSDGSTTIGSASLDSNGKGTLSLTSLTVGTHSISASYAGDSNFSGSTSSAVSQLITKAPTSVAVTASPNPAVFGQSVTLTATIAPSGSNAAIPTGTVTLTDGPTTIGTITVDNTGKAVLSLSSLSGGVHSISATYSGDNNFSVSTSPPVSETVNKSPTAMTLASTPNPGTFGQAVVLTATVTATPGIPSGVVSFADGATTIGSAPLDKTGQATISVSSFAAGSHTVTANYSGDANFGPSSASGAGGVSQVVSQSGTTTALSTSLSSSVYGQPVVFTAAVTAPGGVPSGTVSFLEGAVTLGTAALDSSGSASLTINSLTVGLHSISAVYSGSTNYLSSRSGTVSQTVNRNSVSLTLTSATNPSTFGQAVVFTVKAAPAPPGGATGTAIPGGTVSFSDGTSVLGSATLDSNGVATFTTSALTAGSHTITANYGGDANFSKGSSSQMQAVQKIPTAISLTTSMNPATNASSITLTGIVRTGTIQAPSVTTPTGTVSFSDGAQQLGTAQLDNTGQARLSVSHLATGSHTLLANYAGDINSEPSLSEPLVETITPANNGDFSLSINPTAVQVTAGNSASAQLAVVPVNGLTGPIDVSCTGIPQGSTCSIAPKMLALDGKSTVKATILVSTTGPQPTASNPHSSGSGQGQLAWLSLLPVAFGGVLIPRSQRKRLGTIASMMLVAFLVGCGGTRFPNKPPVASTPPGNYTLTVQAMSGHLTHTVQLRLSVR